MRPEGIDSLWQRFLDAEPLSAEESARLLGALESDERLRAELLADEDAHWALRALARAEDPADGFVARVESRIREEGAARHEGPAAPPRVLPPALAPWLRRRRWALSLAAVLAFAALVGGWLLGPGSRGVASIAHAEDAVWSGAAPGARLREDQDLELLEGTVEIRFDHGARIRLVGPTRVRVGREACTVRFGAVAARLPAARESFLLETPLSVVRESGIEVSLRVDRDGSTAVEALSGPVRLHSRREDGEAITLDPAGLRRATVSAPAIPSGLRPAVTRAAGATGSFLGRISMAGETVECRDAASFDRLVEEISTRSRRDQLLADWGDLADRFGVGAPASVSVTVGGASFRAADLSEALRLDSEVRDALEALSQESSFSASIVVDGVRREFSSREEFEAARDAATRPLSSFKMLRLGDRSRVEVPPSTRSVRTSRSESNGVFRGEIEVDGRVRIFDDPTDFERALEELDGAGADTSDGARQARERDGESP